MNVTRTVKITVMTGVDLNGEPVEQIFHDANDLDIIRKIAEKDAGLVAHFKYLGRQEEVIQSRAIINGLLAARS
jgi:hypothetical protein